MVVGAFTSREALQKALLRLRQEGFTSLETYSPNPPEEGGSALPLIILLAAILGITGGFLMQVYADTVAYPMNIGGRPDFSWPAFVPIAFEMGVLAAMAAAFVGFLIANRMPQLYHRVDAAAPIRRASIDRWCVVVRTDRPDRARRLLWTLAAREVEEVPA